MKLRILVLLGCSLIAQYSNAHEHIPSSCPVTKEPDPPFVPPAPYPEKEAGRFWLGTNALWTSLAEDGIWRGIVSPSGMRDKFWWWREGWEPDTDWRDHDPGLIVTARRLDADAPVVQVPEATNGKLGSGWAMLTMLELPTSGCWEITGNYRSEHVSMVVWVPNRPLDENR
jgi:hypothetical protein